ncbi:MAG: hypothetical protein NZU63_12625 [Gemmataceae bacterium]|nr:hypothetical protein [Gemmataceae bacterium]MDW8243247.1 hypothetical protein [Thermogemmata sp.]
MGKTAVALRFGDDLLTAQELRAALQASPFRLFTIHIADGRSFEVRHHDFLLLGPNGRTAFVFSPSWDRVQYP